jgi:filamentous hemagglutinin
LAKVSGGDFKTGALAAGANEALVADLYEVVKGNPNLLSMSSQLVGLLAASTQSGADGDSLKTGAWVAQNGTQYNFVDHLPPSWDAYGQAVTTQMEDMQKHGASAEEIADAGRAAARGAGFDGVQPGTGFVKAWGEFMAGELSGLGFAAILGKIASGFAIGAKGGSGVADDFFAGTKYTDKVLGQIKTGDLHGFPEVVTTFQGAGQVTKITGGDGVVRDMLKIPGEYRGKQGVFEFIKESIGSINHRLFRPTPAE